MTAIRDRPFPFARARSTIPRHDDARTAGSRSVTARRGRLRPLTRHLAARFRGRRPDRAPPLGAPVSFRDGRSARPRGRHGRPGAADHRARRGDDALEWAGDHAASLGANPGRLFVAGGGLAATAALHARDEGWPPLARQLLSGPERSGWPPADASLAGVAPATVVDGPVYAGRLRAAGVEVEELPLAAPMSFERPAGIPAA